MEGKKSLPEGYILTGKKTYRILSVLGKGGYGITYLATGEVSDGNISHTVKYAIKEFFMDTRCRRNADGSVTFDDSDGKSVKDYLKAFKVEAVHLKDLNEYEGIVSVNEIFEQGGTIYYVMAHLGDVTLEKQIGSKGMCEGEAMKTIAAIGKALTYVHQHKMNHLDVKPANIMITGHGPVLIDFGLSRHYGILGGVTNDSSPYGVSDGYSPSEQYAGVEQFSPPTDVYALAATLFHMLTGHAPVRFTKITEDYLRKELGDRTSEQRIDAIIRAMRYDVISRTQSVSQFIEELGISDIGEGTVTIPIDPKRKISLMKMTCIAVGIVLVFIAVFAISYMVNSCKGKEKGGNTPSAADTTDVDTIKRDTMPAKVVFPATKTRDSLERVIDSLKKQQQVTPAPTPANPAKQKGDVVKPTPKPATQRGTVNIGYGTWSGEIRDGKPYGQGTLTYSSDRRVDSRDDSGTYAAAGDHMTGVYKNGHWTFGSLFDASGNRKATISIGE